MGVVRQLVFPEAGQGREQQPLRLDVGPQTVPNRFDHSGIAFLHHLVKLLSAVVGVLQQMDAFADPVQFAHPEGADDVVAGLVAAGDKSVELFGDHPRLGLRGFAAQFQNEIFFPKVLALLF